MEVMPGLERLDIKNGRRTAATIRSAACVYHTYQEASRDGNDVNYILRRLPTGEGDIPQRSTSEISTIESQPAHP